MASADELPDGYDEYEVAEADDAVISGDTDRKVLTDDDEMQAWWFDLKDISWYRANQIFGENIEQDPETGQGSIDPGGYYRDVAEEMVVDWSGSDDMNLRQFLTGLRADLGQQFENWLPDPGEVQVEEEDEGKSALASDDESHETQ